MKNLILCALMALSTMLFADNQTPTVSPIVPEDGHLPFTVEIAEADFQLLTGLHSFAAAIHDGKWLILCGRTNGLHGFSAGNNNFPPDSQNRIVYVVDPTTKYVAARSLADVSSGLDVHQIDTLSVTSPQAYQSDDTLYITGGYGVESSTGNFSTKNTLTAIDVPGLMKWVMHPDTHHKAKDFIRQIKHDAFRVTGGDMYQIDDEDTLLVFGQNFKGFYVPGSNGEYTEQVRRFTIKDDGKKLHVHMKKPKPLVPDPNYRRRDLNIVPVMQYTDGKTVPGLIALSGVFTLTGGAWTVPVEISSCGCPSMSDPNLPSTFKQGMNNYVSATLGLYSKQHRDMYSVIFGGMSFGYFNNGNFETDPELPFINQVTTIKRDHHGHYSQYLMNAAFPTIDSTQVNAPNPLLFGSGALFFPADGLEQFANGVLKLDRMKKGRHFVGYIAGGIQSTLPNTNTQADSTASAYIFNVYVVIP